MRFKQIIETTTAGSVATVAKPMMTQTRENTNVKGLKPVDQMKKGAKKKGPYANSIAESKVKELTMDLTQLNNDEFQKKYRKTKAEIRVSMKNVNEDDLAEQDLIVIPGQGRLRKTGFVKHDLDQGEHEGHTLKNSLHTIARAASELDERLSVQSEFPEWVSEKIGAAKGMMVTVMDYLISSQEMQHDRDDINEYDAGTGDFGVYLAAAFAAGKTLEWAKMKWKEYKASKKTSNQDTNAINEGDVSTSNLRTMYDLARMTKNHCSPEGQESLNQLIKIIKWYMDQAEQGVTEAFDLGDLRKAAASSRSPEDERALGRNPDFGKLMQKSVNRHNKAIVKTKQAVGSRIADIGAGGKEYNVKTDAAWDAAKKKVSEGSASKEKQKTPFVDRDSPESKAKIQAARDKAAKDKAAEPGKKLADKIATTKKA
jgi:hypothetical protein